MNTLTRQAAIEAGLIPAEEATPREMRIVHLGLGAFFRAHQAWYTHRVDADREWGISAYTGRSAKAAEELGAQDGLYTLVERGPDGDSRTVIPLLSAVHPADDIASLANDVANPRVHIVTLTITEAGYAVDAKGRLDESHDDVAADLAALRSFAREAADARPATMATALGRLSLALEERRRSGGGPITVIPCDNLPGNGPLTQRVLERYGDELGVEYLAWFGESVSVCSTSIDRITPKSTEDDRASVRDALGLEDASPVLTEPFASWIIEGEFLGDRPAWEEAGAVLTEDLEPFENRKLWLLNGAHTLMATFGVCRGHESVAEAMADPDVRAAVDAWWRAASRHLPEHVEAAPYCEALAERFENSRIRHLLAQIMNDSLTKLRVRLVPVAHGERNAGRDASEVVPAVAAWIALQEAGEASPDALEADIARARDTDDPRAALLALVDADLAAWPEFAQAVMREVEELREGR